MQRKFIKVDRNLTGVKKNLLTAIERIEKKTNDGIEYVSVNAADQLLYGKIFLLVEKQNHADVLDLDK